MQSNDDDRDIDDLFATAFTGELPADIEARMERQYRWAEAALSPQRPRPALRPLRTAMAAMGLCVVGALAWIALDTLWQPKVTWAEVADSFGGVHSLAVTLLETDYREAPTMRTEFWMNSAGQVRMHSPKCIVFAGPDRDMVVFDGRSGKRLEPDDLTDAVRRELDLPAPGFFSTPGVNSLDNLLRQFTESASNPAPALNDLPSVSRDLLVFDTGDGQATNWMRVWALQESRLPIRARTWDSDDGGTKEILFDYTGEQPAEAFDPDAYEAALATSSGVANRRFALLQDPAGQALTPADIYAENGFHLPEIRNVGRTQDGILWVESHHAMNQTPEGQTFYGFGKLEDNLGQEYLPAQLGYRVNDHVVLEYFIPLQYGLDYQPPTSYTLTAWNQPTNHRAPTYEIGSRELKNWEESAPIPRIFKKAPTTQDVLQTLIAEWALREHWENFDQLIATIPGDPSNDALARFRDIERLKKLNKMGKEDEAFTLSSRLISLILADTNGFPWNERDVMQIHVVLLVKRGQLHAATDLLAPYRSDFQSPDHAVRPFFLANFVYTLEACQTAPETMETLFGFDPRSLPDVARQLAMMGGSTLPHDDDPLFQPWRDYLNAVEKHVDSHPLTEDFTLISDHVPCRADGPAFVATLPKNPDYAVRLFGPNWDVVAAEWANTFGNAPEHIVIAPTLADKPLRAVVIYRKTLRQEYVLRQLVAHLDVTIIESSKRKNVWVANYDGRALPYWRTVRPADIGDDIAIQAGGTTSSAHAVLKQFERSLNLGDDTATPIIVIDETGLPSKPGENQTWGTICLAYQYAFGTTPDSVAKAKTWFRDNFGITFTEAIRDLPVLEVVPNS